jgi:hypothetical protein
MQTPWHTNVFLFVLVSVLLLIFFLNDFEWQLPDMGEDILQPQNDANMAEPVCGGSTESVHPIVNTVN